MVPPKLYPRRPCLLPLLTLGVLLLLLPRLIAFATPHYNIRSLLSAFSVSISASAPPRRQTKASFEAPPPHTPPHCVAVGYNPNLKGTWFHNSRSHCLVSAVCLRPHTLVADGALYLAADPNGGTCGLVHPDFTSVRADHPPLNCTDMRERNVFCAHGRYLDKARPQRCMPTRRLLDMSAADNASASWIASDRVAIVIPAFPWLGNIYHYSFVGMYLVHVVSELHTLFTAWGSASAFATSTPPSRITLVFRAEPPAELGHWQAAVTAILLRRLAGAAGISDVAVQALHEDTARDIDPSANSIPGGASALCAHSAVFLGQRGAMNLWGFPNSSAVPTAGGSVPATSVAMRRAIYDEFSIPARLPALPTRDREGSHEPFARTAVFDLPPLVLGYSQRPMMSDPPPGQNITYGWRRFSDADELWFTDMLAVEAKRANATVRNLSVLSTNTVAEQVRWYASVGLLVGIHGANLVNAIFSPVFGGLVEITPGGHLTMCYYTGGNAGLAYWEHEAEQTTPAESFCSPTSSCFKFNQHRRVKLTTSEHRQALTAKVRAGLDYLTQLHSRFPNGIPAKLSLPEQRYIIDWDAP